MTHKERIVRHLAGEPVDRIPMFGGWNLGARNIAEMAGLPIDQYLADPWAGVLAANRRLDVDGLVMPIVPADLDSIRAGSLQEEHFAVREPEELLERAECILDSEAAVLREKFIAEKVEDAYRKHFEEFLGRYGDIALVPTLWGSVANFSLYFEYGYEAFLAATALYPEALERIWWESGVLARASNEIIIQLIREYDLIPLVFCGHDICNNDGPMCSPAMLHERYWPHAAYSIAPFVESSIRLVHHCDGNVMPLVDDMIAAGFSGFQGFQYECGVDPYRLREHRSLRGESMLFMAGLSVTRTLPYGTPEDVIREVEYCLTFTEGGHGLFLFTSNVTGVEVPPANILAAYDHLRAYNPKDAVRYTGLPEQPAPALSINPHVTN